ncbi:unnamed protein product [Lactuca virosa]|uniref:Uncharacterized protein n=1 Tax=Lactuca virosa TaxID=75947 RepID=A0AAU9MQ89_9ASTR|nr:unnamed protein product [Lactuca virosa]
MVFHGYRHHCSQPPLIVVSDGYHHFYFTDAHLRLFLSPSIFIGALPFASHVGDFKIWSVGRLIRVRSMSRKPWRYIWVCLCLLPCDKAKMEKYRFILES